MECADVRALVRVYATVELNLDYAGAKAKPLNYAEILLRAKALVEKYVGTPKDTSIPAGEKHLTLAQAIKMFENRKPGFSTGSDIFPATVKIEGLHLSHIDLSHIY
jgi:hypothetical protein